MGCARAATASEVLQAGRVFLTRRGAVLARYEPVDHLDDASVREVRFNNAKRAAGTQPHGSILRPRRGFEWFTSDHPVQMLNYSGPEQYDFGGRWGDPGTEIIFPVSPLHLVYHRWVVGCRPAWSSRSSRRGSFRSL